MTARFRRTAALLAAALSGVVSPGGAAEWKEILDKPLSPGAVALLVEHPSEPAVRARWSEALKDPRAEVRAAAARAINVAAAAPLLPDLAAALGTETDVSAAAEEAGALAALGGPDREEVLKAAARRDPRFEHAVSVALARSRKRRLAPPPAVPARLTTWLTPGGFPPGLVPDVLKVSGCPPGRQDTFHGGQVAYDSDGRPREVTMLAPADVKPACVEAVKALLFLALAPVEPTSHRDLVIVPLAPEVIACMGEPLPLAMAPSAPSRVGGHIEEPKKVRHVNPWYPDAAKNDRVQGTVVLEAVIAPTGCVSSVKLLQSRDPRLDLVSLITVAQWRYTPTLLGGVAVPVIMTVTVNFRLS